MRCLTKQSHFQTLTVAQLLKQNIPGPVQNPKVHYCVPKSKPPDLILSYMNIINTLTDYLFTIHFNIILPATPRSAELSLPFKFSD
jgi:hypothetical protein